MTSVQIYHNPRCGKSRSACVLLAERGITPRVIEYLKERPTAAELEAVLAKLGIAAAELVRRGEAEFKAHYAGKTLTEAEWIAAMVAHPILIERPIVIVGNRAVVARPPEKLLDLL